MKFPSAIGIVLLLSGCGFSCSSVPQPSAIFNPDLAYSHILKYEKFGPKVPGSKEHLEAGKWIIHELKGLGLTVHEQIAGIMDSNQKPISIRNIIAQYRPDLKKRILLSAHWDNRPHADQETSPKKRIQPVPGVNDGGSGVAVLLGIAEAISKTKPEIGIDFAFWDAEDGGTHSNPKSYCLGSQYWSQKPIPESYQAEFGINLDMVGRKGSVFPIEAYSMYRAPKVLMKLKKAAMNLGYQDYFPDYQIGPIVDDHYYVSEGRGFPMVDLIYMTEQGKFAPEWHTLDDTSEFISREVMKIVGQTILELISNELK